MAKWDRYKGSMTSSSNMPWDIGGAATPTTQPPKPVRGRGPKRKRKARPNSNLQKRAKEAGSVYSKAFFAATVDAMAHNTRIKNAPKPGDLKSVSKGSVARKPRAKYHGAAVPTTMPPRRYP